MYTRFTCLRVCACAIALQCAYDGLVVDVSEKENVREVFKNMDLDPHEQNLM